MVGTLAVLEADAATRRNNDVRRSQSIDDLLLFVREQSPQGGAEVNLLEFGNSSSFANIERKPLGCRLQDDVGAQVGQLQFGMPFSHRSDAQLQILHLIVEVEHRSTLSLRRLGNELSRIGIAERFGAYNERTDAIFRLGNYRAALGIPRDTFVAMQERVDVGQREGCRQEDTSSSCV